MRYAPHSKRNQSAACMQESLPRRSLNTEEDAAESPKADEDLDWEYLSEFDPIDLRQTDVKAAQQEVMKRILGRFHRGKRHVPRSRAKKKASLASSYVVSMHACMCLVCGSCASAHEFSAQMLCMHVQHT